MKKLFLLILGVFLGSGFVAAQLAKPVPIPPPEIAELEALLEAEEMYGYGYPVCEFSDEEIELLQMVVDVFTTNAETKIVNRLFVTNKGKDLVRSFTEEFLASIDNALNYCENGYAMGYAPWNFDEFKMDLQKYVQTLFALKAFEVKMSGADPVAASFDQLRNIIIGDSLEKMDVNGRSKQLTTMLMSLQMKDMYTDVDFGINLNADTVGKNDGSILQSSIGLGGEIKMQGDGGNINTSGEMTGEMRIIDGVLYVKLQDFDIELGDIEFDNQYDAQGFNEMLQGVQFIQGKYIEIPLVPEGIDGMMMNPFGMYGMAGLGDIQKQQQMIMDVMNEDWLTTYHEDGGMKYGGLNPMACKSMQPMGTISSCLDAWMEIYDHTGGKGMFFMIDEGDQTSMGITDAFTDDMPEELASLSGIPLISWNTNEITSINIPFREDGVEFGSLKYNDGKMVLQGAFPDEIYNWEEDTYETQITKVNVTGQGIGTNMDLKGSITNPEMDITFSADLAGDIDDMKIHMMINVQEKNPDYPSDFNMEILLEQTNSIIQPQNITKPEDREILDMDMLL